VQRFRVGVSIAVSALALTPACGLIENSRTPAPPIAETTRPGASATTITALPATPIAAAEVCALVNQADLDAIGVLALAGEGHDAGGRYALGTGGPEASCEWFLSSPSDTFTLTAAVGTGVGSAAFEEVLADEGSSDPFTVDGVGEMAAYVEYPAGLRSTEPGSAAFVLSDGKVLKLESGNTAVVSQAQLVALAETAAGRL
jgi:hypothetical protein